jgi:hypothetical protein
VVADLQQRLLNQTIRHRRDAQLALATIRFWNHDFAYRTGSAPPRKQSFTPIRLDHESFVVSCPFALLLSALYPVLAHRLAVSLHASFPHSVTLMQLRFASLAVINLREDFHLRECAHAGRTQKTHHGGGSVRGKLGDYLPFALSS